uniref:CCHC-type domain-containing protein n=1 Tax=Amphimedon queenslandica TaxID=400682 RepID=A0A1X7U5C1_AMPQE
MRKEEKRCHGCQGLGHLYQDCPNRDRPKDKGEKPAKTDQRRCFKCKNIVHVAANCKSAMSMGYFVEKGQQRRQRKTGEIVFWGSVQEEPVEMLVDTGCCYTLVQRRLVPDQCLLKGETVALQCAHRDVTKYPVAEVDIELKGIRKRVKVGVSDTLPKSVLAGTDVLAEFGAKTVEDCMVMTRSQQARELEEEAERMRRQAEQ